MCDIWKRTDQTELRRSDLEPHRESLRRLQVKWVVLSGGEPLLHQDLRSLCQFFRNENIRMTLLTSGLLLGRRAQEVVDSFDDVIVSIDGPEDTHDRIRGVPGGFRVIQAGIAAVRELNPKLTISARCTIQRDNWKFLNETVAAAKSLALNSISFLAADLTSEAFNRLQVWPVQKQMSIALSEHQVAELEWEMERFIENFADDIRTGFIAESPSKLRRIVQHFRSYHGQVKPQSPTCNAPWVSAVVEVDGAVRPCFFHRPIGNLREGTLESIVNGTEGIRFRKSLDVESNAICQRCVCSLNYRES